MGLNDLKTLLEQKQSLLRLIAHEIFFPPVDLLLPFGLHPLPLLFYRPLVAETIEFFLIIMILNGESSMVLFSSGKDNGDANVFYYLRAICLRNRTFSFVYCNVFMPMSHDCM